MLCLAANVMLKVGSVHISFISLSRNGRSPGLWEIIPRAHYVTCYTNLNGCLFVLPEFLYYQTNFSKIIQYNPVFRKLSIMAILSYLSFLLFSLGMIVLFVCVILGF